MGNLLILSSGIWSLNTSYKHFYLSRLPIYDERVELIEERCVDLNNPLRLIGGKHSFIVIHTQSGKRMRMEFVGPNQDVEILENYIELAPSEVFRRLIPKNGTTVKRAIETFVEVAARSEYNAAAHNCQHVVRDTVAELTGKKDLELRNEYLSWMAWRLGKPYISRPDPLHQYSGTYSETRNDTDRAESILNLANLIGSLSFPLD